MKVALVGRPNVGKSTLFNRLTGRKLALVHDQPGVTRDRRYAPATLSDLSFTLIDTAGLADPNQHAFTNAMIKQTELALQDADILLFMVDAKTSCTPYDFELARMLAKYNKPLLIVANKAESHSIFPGALDATSFGIGEVIEISAEHGQGLDALYDFLILHIPVEEIIEDEPAHLRPLRLAIMGRPNAGKSTLINALVGEERQLTGDTPGLTRDAIRIDWEYEGQKIQLIDTAGIRRNARVDEVIERLSVQDAKKALQFSEVVILTLDATCALEKQDLTLAYDIYNEGRAMIIALNKWDLVKDADKKAVLDEIHHKIFHQLAQAKDIPIVGLSALRGKGLDELMGAVLEMYRVWNIRIPTAKLNAWLSEVVAKHPAPAVGGRRIRPKYMTQAKSRPPTFVLFCSQAEKLPESYTRYLTNSLRQVFKLPGVPIRFHVRGGNNPYVGKK